MPRCICSRAGCAAGASRELQAVMEIKWHSLVTAAAAAAAVDHHASGQHYGYGHVRCFQCSGSIVPPDVLSSDIIA